LAASIDAFNARRLVWLGVNILSSIEFLKEVLPAILHHHERYDGNGNQIPLEARILSVADTYDGLTSDRPYRKGMSHEFAIDELTRNKGSQFDSNIVDALIKIEGELKNIVL